MRFDFKRPPTPEEEQVLIERMLAGDQAARAELIERNLLLVRHVSRRYANCGIDEEERFSLGCVGLVYAVDHYDPAHGVRLATFIGRTVEGRYLNAIRYGRVKMRAGGAASLDAPVKGRLANSGAERTLGDLLPSREPQPVDLLEENEEQRALHAAVDALPDELRRYVQLRFCDAQVQSQKDAGKVFGWSQMTAHRREVAALGMCRAALAGAGY